MKVAISGVWHVHAPQYAAEAMKHGELVGVWDKDPEWRRAFAKKHGIREFKTLDELLASEAEGVIVCTASSEHMDVMIKIAEAGKDIFTEKVLALTAKDCLKVKAAVEKNGVRFVISLFQKYLAPIRTALSIARSGDLGKINYVRFRNCHTGASQDWLPKHFYSLEECGGGAMIDLGAHGMYIIEALLGVPERAKSIFTVANVNPASAERNKDGVEDNAVTLMSYPDGAIAINETGFVSAACPRVLEIGGDRGYVRVIGDTLTKSGELVDTADCLEAEPAPIVQFLTAKILPGCGIDEAIALTKMMEMAYANA